VWYAINGLPYFSIFNTRKPLRNIRLPHACAGYIEVQNLNIMDSFIPDNDYATEVRSSITILQYKLAGYRTITLLS